MHLAIDRATQIDADHSTILVAVGQ